MAKPLCTYTAFCREATGDGTTWIAKVDAEDIDQACESAVEECSEAWGMEPDEVRCVGLATGDISIEYWDDGV